MEEIIENSNHIYAAIDLKSFYASVECVERGLDPLTARLVVADISRTDKTICLAVSPALKEYGIPGRARLFEVVQKAKKYSLDYIAAPPRMALYMEYSAKIYGTYLKYIAPEDIHAYSVDEVFIDITHYGRIYGLSPRGLVKKLVKAVYDTTGITATAGIGTNLYLCKIAMDIMAKHADADCDGVRIACLDEMSYRRLLWGHTPITDFWRVGRGYAKKLAEKEIYTMGDVARCSVGSPYDYYNEDLLYQMFGVNAELLIDHAWGFEPCTIADIKAYRPETNSISSGQVLKCPYTSDKARLVVHEMADALALSLLDKRLVTNQIILTIGYDVCNLREPSISRIYKGDITVDAYGRRIPKHAHGTENLARQTSSSRLIIKAAMDLYDRIINQGLLIRRINIVAAHVVDESLADDGEEYEQLDMFTDYDELEKKKNAENDELERERKLQEAVLSIKKKYGKNSVLKGMDYLDGATAIERNSQIGGHKA